jgi:DNA polymerase V
MRQKLVKESSMPTEIEFIYRALQGKSIARPLFSTRVPAGFPSPSESYIEGRIDLNKELLRHPLATFYVRVSGDSMIGVGIHPNSLLVVDRAEEARDGHVVIARLGDELCVKRLSFGDNGEILLISENDRYPAIRVKPEDDFEVWGRVLYSIHTL